jgi:uncharacterized protein YcbK (DUF882 family)
MYYWNRDRYHRAKNVEAENEKVRMLLRERVKELTTLYRSSQILQTEEKPIEKLLEEIVSILPSALQHSDTSAARISLGKTELKPAILARVSSSIRLFCYTRWS